MCFLACRPWCCPVSGWDYHTCPVHQPLEVSLKLRWSTGSHQSSLASMPLWLGAVFKTQHISTQKCISERNQRTGMGGKGERTPQLWVRASPPTVLIPPLSSRTRPCVFLVISLTTLQWLLTLSPISSLLCNNLQTHRLSLFGVMQKNHNVP